jgi:hypothetical protein
MSSSLSPEAQQAVDNIKRGIKVDVSLADLYKWFKNEIGQVLGEIAEFTLQEHHLKSYKNVKRLYNETKRLIGGKSRQICFIL